MIAQILNRPNRSDTSDQIIDLVGSVPNVNAVHLGVIVQNRRTERERYFYLITSDCSYSGVVEAIRTHCGKEWKVYETFDVTMPKGHTLSAV